MHAAQSITNNIPMIRASYLNSLVKKFI